MEFQLSQKTDSPPGLQSDPGMTMTMTRQWRGSYRNRIRNGNSKWHLHVPVIRPKGEQGSNLMNQHQHHHQPAPASAPASDRPLELQHCRYRRSCSCNECNQTNAIRIWRRFRVGHSKHATASSSASAFFFGLPFRVPGGKCNKAEPSP